jgi:hypothetical protein
MTTDATTDAELEKRVDRAVREADVKAAKKLLDAAIARLQAAVSYVGETTDAYIAAADRVRDDD